MRTWFFEAIDEDRDEFNRPLTIVSVSSEGGEDLLTLALAGRFDPDNHSATDALGAAVLQKLMLIDKARPGDTVEHMRSLEQSGGFDDFEHDDSDDDDADFDKARD